MCDARELTVAQIGEVLGVRRTSIYRALAQDGVVGLAPWAATGRQLSESPSLVGEVAAAGDAPGAAATAMDVVKGRRSVGPWFLVEADEHDPAGPVAVVSRFASARAARAALARARSQRPGEQGMVLEVRTGAQIGSRLEWDADLGRTVVRDGPPST